MTKGASIRRFPKCIRANRSVRAEKSIFSFPDERVTITKLKRQNPLTTLGIIKLAVKTRGVRVIERERKRNAVRLW